MTTMDEQWAVPVVVVYDDTFSKKHIDGTCVCCVAIGEKIVSDMRAENYDIRTLVKSLHDDIGGTTGDTRCYYLGRHPLKRAAR